MRRYLYAAAFAVCLLAGGANAAGGVSVVDGAAIRDVIQRQLDAFQRDDGVAAFSYASPDIKAMFRDPETFMRMVRTGYEPVYRPREVEFRGLDVHRGQLAQRVLLVGPDNVPVIALYIMEEQPDGTWRIDGCILRPADDTMA